MKQFVLVIFFCLSFQHCWCQEELLTCVEAEAKLPTPLAFHSSFYDGNDSIYIFGGYDDSIYVNTIYSYDINLDSISLVATFPERIAFATVTFHNKIIYIIGGANEAQNSDKIYKFDPESKTVTLAGHVDLKMWSGVGMKYNESSNTVQILARGSNGLQCLNLTSLSSCGQTSLIDDYPADVRAFVKNGFAYIFAEKSPSSQIERINLSTLESELIPGDFPFLYYPPSVVFDGKYGYLIGGHRENQTGIRTNGIIRYDPETFEHIFIPVENFPVIGTQLYSFGSAEYVEKLNRIYMFGGIVYGDNGGHRNEIWYIDLNTATTEGPIPTTLNPDIFSCEEKLNGIFPNPYHCDQFIICYNGTSEYYTCPSPLLFDPVLLACSFPQEVSCEISCNEKPNGMYPHPQACDLFIGCYDGTVEVYKCPEPLLFDPVTKQCNRPDQVECAF